MPISSCVFPCVKNAQGKYISFDFDIVDLAILKEIKTNKSIGTITLAKSIGISPKGLIHNLKRYSEDGWIKIGKIKAKPKGWHRTFEITTKGEEMIKWFENLNKAA